LALNNRYFTNTATEWGRNQIQARASFLAQQILSIWPSLDPSKETVAEAPAMEFSWAALEHVARTLDKELLKVSQSRFTTADNATRVVGLCSKVYINAASRGYWYGFKPTQLSFLQEATSAWLALECEKPDKVLLIPLEKFAPTLPRLNSTEGKHWHIALDEENHQIWLHLPHPEPRMDLSEYLLC